MAWLDTVSSAGLCQDIVAAPPACERVFLPKGNHAPGQGCDSGGDCALSSEGDVVCLGPNPEQRICQLVVQGTEGSAPCAWTERDGESIGASNLDQSRVYSCDTADGLRCGGNACVRLVPEGGACVVTEECVVGTFCSPEGGCQPLLPVGAACKFYDQCLNGECTNQVCVPESEDFGLRFLCGVNGE
jgi:hypothetical protein